MNLTHKMETGRYIFPLAFAMNTLAVSGFMVVLGLLGKQNMAADFGIVQAATMALFFAFSANARSLILSPAGDTSLRFLLVYRSLLIVPLAAAAFFLSATLGGAPRLLALVLICRRAIEWIAELHLSDTESRENRSFAKVFIVTHAALFVFAVWWSLSFESFQLPGIAVWAISPLILHLGFIHRTLTSSERTKTNWVHITPHFGSTAINGVTVYVFRLFLLLLVGKAVAGDLYTAFAIGGFVGTTYLNALGPSLVHHEGLNGGTFFPRWLKVFLSILFLAGLCMFLAVERDVVGFPFLGKSAFFWGATGLSMIGGSIMVLALRIRIGILQLTRDREVFGPDLIINIFIVAVVPFSFYLFGKDILRTLFLFNALIALIIYSNARGGLISNIRRRFIAIPDAIYKAAIAFCLIFPLFFQLNGHIFNDTALVFNSKGILTLLPIPISVFACFGGLLLIGSYKRARLSLYVIFLTFLLMLTSTIVLSMGQGIDKRDKLIFVVQLILPFFGLILGQIFEADNDHPQVFEKIIILVLLLVVPAQLSTSLETKLPLLYPHVYFFSIYQHFQYVTTILVCLYLFALFSLWRKKAFKVLLILLAPLMVIYAITSVTLLAVLAFLSGVLGFCYVTLFKRLDKLAVFLVLLIGCTTVTTYYYAKNTSYWWQKYSLFTLNTTGITQEESPKATVGAAQQASNETAGRTDTGIITDIKNVPNVSLRIKVWLFHIKGIFKDAGTFFLGHTERPLRYAYPSAHNYYLDLIYNFGFIAAIPILGLLIITIRALFHQRKKVISNPGLFGLALVTLFLLLVDNSLKVGLRQPYSGLITFFLWGLLLSRLTPFRSDQVDRGDQADRGDLLDRSDPVVVQEGGIVGM